MTDLLGTAVSTRTPKGSIPRWAARYGYSERQVKKWITLGREKGDPAPFDRPECMQDWAIKNLGKATRKFMAGVARAMGEETPEQAPAQESEPLEPMELPGVHDSDLGLEVQLDRYRREWAMLGKLRTQALEAREFSRASNYFEQMQKVSSEIRQLERLLPTVLEQRGDFMRTAEVRSATTEFLVVLKRSLLGRAIKAATRLRAASSDADLQAAWRTEIEAVFRECCAAGFEEVLALE